jgi:hypothetical protein
MSETKDMGQEHCIKEGEIASLKTELTDLVNIVKKNGLQKQVTELNVVIPELKDTVADLSNNVRELLDMKIINDTEKSVKLTANQKFWSILFGIAGVAATIVMITDMILKNKAG